MSKKNKAPFSNAGKTQANQLVEALHRINPNVPSLAKSAGISVWKMQGFLDGKIMLSKNEIAKICNIIGNKGMNNTGSNVTAVSLDTGTQKLSHNSSTANMQKAESSNKGNENARIDDMDDTTTDVAATDATIFDSSSEIPEPEFIFETDEKTGAEKKDMPLPGHNTQSKATKTTGFSESDLKYAASLVQRRNDLGMSQEEIASVMGMSRALYGAYERGYRKPSDERKQQIEASFVLLFNKARAKVENEVHKYTDMDAPSSTLVTDSGVTDIPDTGTGEMRFLEASGDVYKDNASAGDVLFNIMVTAYNALNTEGRKKIVHSVVEVASDTAYRRA